MNKIPHKVYKHLRWVNNESDGHATVQLGISLNKEGYHTCGKEFPGATQRQDANLRAVVDTGCMATYMGVDRASSLGTKKKNLINNNGKKKKVKKFKSKLKIAFAERRRKRVNLRKK